MVAESSVLVVLRFRMGNANIYIHVFSLVIGNLFDSVRSIGASHVAQRI
jgi:hypothetical protein